jgi:hypothetical protein
LPQGCAKKIDVGLLLADFALQLCDTGVGASEWRIRCRPFRRAGFRSRDRTLGGTTNTRKQTIHAAQSILLAPPV